MTENTSQMELNIILANLENFELWNQTQNNIISSEASSELICAKVLRYLSASYP